MDDAAILAAAVHWSQRVNARGRAGVTCTPKEARQASAIASAYLALRADLDRIRRGEVHPSHEWVGPDPLKSCARCGIYPSSRESFFLCDRRMDGETVSCCECGDDYPAPDLFRGHIFCQKCRITEAARKSGA